MRVVPGALAGQAGAGVDTRRLTSGAEGLGRLLKAFVSAQWIRDAMEAWGEEVVGFIFHHAPRVSELIAYG
jgi:RAD50-interacting protein 1